jgi:2-dehydro-3-deoxyphosphogluconate aldolase/(4S)-4-hydroxy-2-oxoglutarate aldolase
LWYNANFLCAGVRVHTRFKEKKMDTVEILKKAGVIPVIVLEDAAHAVPLARALVKGGLPVLEITFRTAAAPAAIEKIRQEVPEAVVGAGTLLTGDMVRAAHAAGAVFGVAPGFDPAVVRQAADVGMPFVPGVATASELSQALTAGARLVKFFPAEAAGGVKMIKNLLGAFRFTGVRIMPTGGINLDNLADYLSVPEVVACGGTWLVPPTACQTNDWTEIEKRAADAAARVRALRAAH